MKDLYKVIGIITFLTIISFNLSGCGENKEKAPRLKVVNQNNEAITKVELSNLGSSFDYGVGDVFDNLNITTDSSQIFKLSADYGGYTIHIRVYFGANQATVSNVWMYYDTGGTSTVTLDASGNLKNTSDYLE